MREAHKLGMRTTATMMFGHIETVEERIEHLEKSGSSRMKRVDLLHLLPGHFNRKIPDWILH